MSKGFAENLASSLDKAIAYLMNQPISSATLTPGDGLSLYESFFKHVTGNGEVSALSYWRTRFECLDTSTFPSLPSVGYQPRPLSETSHTIKGVEWPRSSPYTSASLVQASWAAVQATHSNSDDVVFGAICSFAPGPVAHSKLASALPLRVSLKDNQKVLDLLNYLHTEITQAPDISVLRIRQLGEEAARAARFEVLLSIVTLETKSKYESEAKEVVRVHDQLGGTGYRNQGILPVRPIALTVHFYVRGSNVQVCANFDKTVVSSELVTRMLWQFDQALRWLVDPAHLQRNSTDIETISPQDLASIWDWNRAVPDSVDLLVHDIFARVVQSQPKAPAISAWDGDLTYRELDDLSTRLAFHLMSVRGVGPGAIVPIYIEKSRWTPVAQLGVMKTGAASVLLDSTQPVDRARSIAKQVRSNVIISSKANEPSASTLNVGDAVVLVLDADFISRTTNDQAVSGEQTSLPKASVPSDPVYVVFTSGSTGSPK